MILVTGGLGYIGSHTVVSLLTAGHSVVIYDNLSNASIDVLDSIEKITGLRPEFVEGDVRDAAALKSVFATYSFTSVLHFAALKAVGESGLRPLEYYDQNVSGTIQLLKAMQAADIRSLVFSSSATVYGIPASVPVTEDFPLHATNPYGRTKLMIEEILADLAASDPTWKISRLRYFNPVGAHESGLIGETPSGYPNNLMPFLAQVAEGKRPQLQVFGGDYPTRDGTGIRDYIHVLDLAEGHAAALKYLDTHGGLQTFNLGRGAGVSVLEMITAFTKVTGAAVPYQIVGRRPGDAPEVWADPARANRDLGWKADRDISAMCRDTWRFQQKRP